MIKIAYDPIYMHPLPEGHRFPMLKYELIPEQLIYEGTFKPENFFVPNLPLNQDILLVHDIKYLDNLLNLKLTAKEVRKIGFPISKELVKRELIITQGTIDCCTYAIQNGVAFNIAGGTHHAFADAGEGFCLLNDVAVAAAKLINEGKCKKILIVDLDVHQGNGTAKIFENSSEVFTFSMHGIDNYPLIKQKSDLDIALPNGCYDEEYLSLLTINLNEIIKTIKPDFMFYVAGVDILVTDKLGKLSVSKLGCKTRDYLVLSTAKNYNIPVVVVMGGGYSPQITDILDAHCNTFRVAAELF